MPKKDYDQDDDEHYKSEEEDEREQTDYGDDEDDQLDQDDLIHKKLDENQSDNDDDQDQKGKFFNDHQSQDSDDDSDSDQMPLIQDEFGVIEHFDDNFHQVSNKERVTSPYLSKYEKAIILGKRAMQIQKGSPVYASLSIQTLKKMNALQIAQTQFQQKKIPYILRRNLPDGSFDDWKVCDLIWIHVD